MDDFANLNVDYVKDRKVCATGRLVSMTHGELANLVNACGGTYVQTPTRSRLILVVGGGGWPSEKDGSIGQVFKRASRLKAYGYPIDFTSEEDFLDQLGMTQAAGAIRGLHTLSDLSRILRISPVRLRRWLRVGLIHPVATQFQMPFFDFHQVAFIKHLNELVENGALLANIRQGIERARDLLPHGESLSSQWSNIERDGRVLMRLSESLIDQTGQTYFDFDSHENAAAAISATELQGGFHDLCDDALAFEEEGLLEEAADAYQRALQLMPDHPTLHFDLGNVMFQLGHEQAAVENFQAAVRLDPEFAIAWHNLGCAQARCKCWSDAEKSLRQALALLPDYADSHDVMAAVLGHLGRETEAADHHAKYVDCSNSKSLCDLREHGLRIVNADEDETTLP